MVHTAQPAVIHRPAYKQQKLEELKQIIPPSEILWVAANMFLAYNSEQTDINPNKQHYSCNSIRESLDFLYEQADNENKIPLFCGDYRGEYYDYIMETLKLLGCDTESSNLFKHLEKKVCDPRYESRFQWYDCTPESQEARYLWLIWASAWFESIGE